jgi:peroxiredoxin
MAIEVGSTIPDVAVKVLKDGAPVTVQTGDVLGTGKVVLIAVPGAFTPGCSKVHLPGYVQNADALLAKGVDTIACISVNDAWVMDAWGEAQGVGDKILMLADGNGDFANAMDLVMDGTGGGLGNRSQRYAAVIEDGVITSLEVEPKPGVDVSSCDNVLTKV